MKESIGEIIRRNIDNTKRVLRESDQMFLREYRRSQLVDGDGEPLFPVADKTPLGIEHWMK